MIHHSGLSRVIGCVERDTLTDGRRVYVAWDPSRPSCMTHADTIEEAWTNLDEVRALWDADYARVPHPVSTFTTPSGMSVTWTTSVSV